MSNHAETSSAAAMNPITPCDRSRILKIAQRLLTPFAEAYRQGQPLQQAVPFEAAADTRSNRKAHNALEAIVRLVAGLAPFLEARSHQLTQGDPQLLVVQQLLVQTIRAHLHLFETPTRGGQALVEAGFLAQALLRAPNALWYNLAESDKGTLRQALVGSRNITPHSSNWLLFPAIVEAALIHLDDSGDAAPTLRALDAFQNWYLGDGLYGDGPQNSFDYYGSYVIHPLLEEMTAVLAPRLPEWSAAEPVLRQRFDRYCEVLERFIAPDGSFPPFGRSLAYRAAAFQPLAIAARRTMGHPTLGWGRLRTALVAVTYRTLESDDHYDKQGWLRIGLAGSQPGLAETYISTGSLYLASQALQVLALPAAHPFWSTCAEPLSQTVVWDKHKGGASRASSYLQADVALEKRQPVGTPRK